MSKGPESLPELTLALRTLGSPRRRHPGDEQERFFAPLLEARRAAARAATVEGAVDAFDAERLRASFDRAIRVLAADHAPSNRAAVRRALEARLQERLEPLRDALSELATRADALLRADDTSHHEAWSRWAEQLRAVFTSADRCWPGVDAALGTGRPPRRGLLARLFRRNRS
jgi:hypothetical protein